MDITATITHETIAAVGTPVGRGGIGIIRISGERSLAVAETLFVPSGHARPVSDGRALFSHRLYYGHIHDPRRQSIVDEVLLAVMKKPHSYTREDVVEIQSHGGPVVIGRILELVLDCGVRLADPGEFTRRAYLNGRIDLTQAESVIDVINARTQTALTIASEQLCGGLREKIEGIQRELLDILAEIEHQIEFGEDAPAPAAVDLGHRIALAACAPVDRLLEDYRTGHVLRDGVKVAVVGKPNVGKSSLVNRLLEKERSLVTEFPGTTRDVIEDQLSIRGVPVVISDTAGLHDASEPVEILGIRKARENIAGSDLVLFVLDLSQPLSREDARIYHSICNKPLILALNKVDLVGDADGIDLPAEWASTARVRISALYDRGFGRLKDEIARTVLGSAQIELENKIIPNLRQKRALDHTRAACRRARRALGAGNGDLAAAALSLQEARTHLESITGASPEDTVLDAVFNRFCVGK